MFLLLWNEERKQNFALRIVEKFQGKFWPQSNKLQTKLIQHSFIKIAHVCFGWQLWWFVFVWTNFALQMRLFSQPSTFFAAFFSGFFEQSSWFTLSFFGKQHQRLNHGWNIIQVTWLYCDFMFLLCCFCDKLMTHNHLCFSDNNARTFFVFQNRKNFVLDGTSWRIGISTARVFSFCHQFSRAHAILRKCAHKIFNCSW